MRKTDTEFNSCVVMLSYIHIVYFPLQHLIYKAMGTENTTGKKQKEEMIGKAKNDVESRRRASKVRKKRGRE